MSIKPILLLENYLNRLIKSVKAEIKNLINLLNNSFQQETFHRYIFPLTPVEFSRQDHPPWDFLYSYSCFKSIQPSTHNSSKYLCFKPFKNSRLFLHTFPSTMIKYNVVTYINLTFHILQHDKGFKDGQTYLFTDNDCFCCRYGRINYWWYFRFSS